MERMTFLQLGNALVRQSEHVRFGLLLLAKLERGIDNYPLMVEDGDDKRMSYLVIAVSTSS